MVIDTESCIYISEAEETRLHHRRGGWGSRQVMRAGVCAAQQTLSAEAAAVLKHSLSLARRRGHAQLTPLHVAATLLSSRASLLRRACLKSQPHHQPSGHPLQCRPLELCFNVALNRLPTSPGHLLRLQPSLSNALIAALKRAQAHQRRGCVEQQQHHLQSPLIAVKVELEQLILSILDDPSVSRVMREAGFSSTAVKNNLDDCYNASSPPAVVDSHRPLINPTAFRQPHLFSDQNPLLLSPQKKPQLLCMNDHVKLVLDVLVGKRRRNTVIIGESLSMAESLIAQLMTYIENGDVPDELKSAQLVKLQFSSVPVALTSKEEVDMNVADLKRKVDSFTSIGRVIIYIGDLRWTVDERKEDPGGDYCGGVDHLIVEIGKLVAWYSNSNMKVWLMATANHQTFVKCQMKQPPLDVVWALQAVSVPSGLSLNAAASGRDSRTALISEISSPLKCCQECTISYEREAAGLRSIHHKSLSDKETAASPQLPSWLKPHANQTLQKDDLSQLRRKYNKLCQSLHQNPQSNQGHHGRNHYYQSCLSKSNILADSDTISFTFPASKPNHGARFRRQQSCHIEFSFSNGSSKNRSKEPNLDSLKMVEDKDARITLALGNSTYTDAVKHDKILMWDLLKENLPWQMETITSIVEALMKSDASNQDQFLLIQGNDNVAKRRLALVIAESMFGSSEMLFCMNTRNNEKTGAEMVERALRSHQKLVVLLEEVEYADPELAKLLADGFDTGKVEARERVSGHAIFILTTDADASYNTSSVVEMELVVQEVVDHKRRAEWDPAGGRSNEMEEVSSIAASSNGLDLNIRADEDEDEEEEGKPGELSPNSSDLTREMTMEPPQNSLKLLKKIKNRFVMNRGWDQEKQGREMFLAKLRRGFEEAGGGHLKVEEKVLEQVLGGSGLYLNRVFGKWVKDIFERSIREVREREKVCVRLSLAGEGERCGKDGFMATSLPKRIPLSYTNINNL